MVDDAGPSPAARALAERFGARYEPHPAPAGPERGPQHRRRALAAASSWCSSTTTSARARAGWRRCSTPRASNPQVDVFTGPIRASPGGLARRAPAGASARRSPRSSSAQRRHRRALRVGRQHGDPPQRARARGTVRRHRSSTAATSRSGRNACARSTPGRAGPVRRRARRSSTVAPAPTRACARSRAPPTRAGAPPGASTPAAGGRPRSARELLTLAGCLGHVVRRRCPAGLTMVAHSAGRLREGLRDARRNGALARRPTRRDAPTRRRHRDPAAATTSSPARAGPSAVSTPCAAARRDEAVNALGAAQRQAPAARARRPPRPAPAAGARARRRAPGAPRAGRRRSAPSCCARATTSSCTPAAPEGRGKFENLNLLLAAHPADGHDWLLVIDDDVELPRGFLDRFLFLCERFSLALAQPAHRLHSHAAWPVTRRRRGQRRARDQLRRDRPGDRVRPRHLRRPAAVPRAAHGLGPGRPLGGARARARLALRRHRRRLDPPPRRSRRRRLLARGRRRRGARVPRRAPVPERRARPSAPSRPTAAGERIAPYGAEGRGRGRVLPEPPRPGARDLGAPPGARRARRRRRGARARPAPARPAARLARAPARAARRARSPSSCASRARRRATACRSPTSPTSRRRASAHYASWGAWAAPALALALRRLRALVPVRAHPRPQRRARRRRGAPRARCDRAPLVVSVHGGDVLYTAGRDQRRRRGRRARPGRRPAGARQQPGHRRAGARPRRRRDARGAPRRRPALRPAPARGATGGRRDGRSGGGPPTLVTVAHLVARKRHADVLRALAVLGQRHPDAALRDHRRRPRADRARRARRPPGGRRAGRLPRAAGAASRRSSRRGAARCS